MQTTTDIMTLVSTKAEINRKKLDISNSNEIQK